MSDMHQVRFPVTCSDRVSDDCVGDWMSFGMETCPPCAKVLTDAFWVTMGRPEGTPVTTTVIESPPCTDRQREISMQIARMFD